MQLRPLAILGTCLLLGASAWAQEGTIAPLPDTMQRITPVDAKSDNILSTRPAGQAPVLVPPSTATAQPVVTPPALIPPLKAPASAMTPPPSTGGPFARVPTNTPTGAAALPTKSPFARATPTGPVIPSGPHDTVATPVPKVDAVEVSEPAPPTPPPVGASPATEDPAQPTEFTSPMFDNATDSGLPRKIIFRVLNKVTAQSTLYKAKPGEIIRFGRLEITAEMCRVSTPNSPSDFAGLLNIQEHLLDKDAGLKPLFHGWMYVSSPSIAALEHPIYDVTMVNCEIATPVKDDPKPSKNTAKSKKK